MTLRGNAPSAAFAGPIKHSVTIRGHRTSISLEPVFWEALGRAAEQERVPLNALVATIDEARIAALSRSSTHAPPHPSNLASAIRIWLWEKYCK
ncbi:ribbon-helix-helix domain-containing protein [Sphingobium sp. DEHP117]|uniref:ribbon-helix-helix domain-containing protein n=1 Tax=Sphingobium sp. DEHP117 TaxID=2993436 RepID=UPI0027D707FF|nr:ribbon-helix-helix domain-containing protein [Sphingobium sp. DEHP117]MDQ4420761.1 ribbon-helix-helix domain-containing protein [Sphingobium sp. DEHP117]